MSATKYLGYLVIGDISGYTAYMAQTELEHSQAVLAELLELVAERFQPRLSVVKFEGDAVFAQAPSETMTNGHSLLDLIDSTYVAFRGRRDGIVKHTTCECNACRRIPMLDLKFMAHFGEYILQDVHGRNELVGSDVNLLHRLTKNHVGEETGWKAYALFTEACISHVGADTEGMFEQVESYEHLGDIKTYNLNLHERYEQLTAKRHVFVDKKEANVALSFDVAGPPPIVWEWMSDPQKRNLYSTDAVWKSMARPGGRAGVGSKNHCAHGKDALTVETILDWRPYDYYTTENDSQPKPHPFDGMTTIHLEPISDGKSTRIHWNVKLKKPLPRLILIAMKPMFGRILGKGMAKMEELMQTELAQSYAAGEPVVAIGPEVESQIATGQA